MISPHPLPDNLIRELLEDHPHDHRLQTLAEAYQDLLQTLAERMTEIENKITDQLENHLHDHLNQTVSTLFDQIEARQHERRNATNNLPSGTAAPLNRDAAGVSTGDEETTAAPSDSDGAASD